MGKVEVVPGDLAQPQCGISGENQKRLLPEVQYVIHAAASIQFDNPIHTDLTLSYVATKTIADFAAKVIFLHLCIAISHAISTWHALLDSQTICRHCNLQSRYTVVSVSTTVKTQILLTGPTCGHHCPMAMPAT